MPKKKRARATRKGADTLDEYVSRTIKQTLFVACQQKSLRKDATHKGVYTLQDGVTQSLLQTFFACRQKARFVLDGWRKKDQNTSSMDLGTAVHKGIELHYSGKPWQYEVRAYCLDATTDRQAGEVMYAKAAALLCEYEEYWRERDAKMNWVAQELKFDVEFKANEMPFRLRGKVDGVYRDKRGGLWLLETKTKSRIDEQTLSDAIAFDFQNLFYLVAAEEHYGEEVRGVLYNVIRTPSLRIGKTETPEAYMERIRQDVQEKRPEHYFMRYECRYSRAQVRRFRSELAVKLREFEAWVVGALATYRNQVACKMYGACPFLGACSSGKMAGYVQDRKLFEELA